MMYKKTLEIQTTGNITQVIGAAHSGKTTMLYGIASCLPGKKLFVSMETLESHVPKQLFDEVVECDVVRADQVYELISKYADEGYKHIFIDVLIFNNAIEQALCFQLLEIVCQRCLENVHVYVGLQARRENS